MVTMAMNGWADNDPAWWLNLQAHPEASVELADGRHTVRARAADGAEPSRLWDRWRDLDTKLDDYAALRSGETALVILEPRPTSDAPVCDTPPKRSAAAEAAPDAQVRLDAPPLVHPAFRRFGIVGSC